MPFLDKNPLDNEEVDDAPDLSTIDGYTLQSQGTFLTKG